MTELDGAVAAYSEWARTDPGMRALITSAAAAFRPHWSGGRARVDEVRFGADALATAKEACDRAGGDPSWYADAGGQGAGTIFGIRVVPDPALPADAFALVSGGQVQTFVIENPGP